MRKVSLIGNSLAYCLNQERQCATNYRPGMTPEEVHVVFEKSLRGERKKRAATRNDTRKERAVRLSPHASGCTGSSHGATASRQRRLAGLNGAGSSSSRKGYPTSAARRWTCAALIWCKPVRMIFLRPRREPAADRSIVRLRQGIGM